jgi:hypothetical protein
VPGYSDLRIQCSQTVRRGNPIRAAFRRGIADVHVALVVEDVAADDEVKRWHVQRGGVDGVCAGLFDDAQLVALRGKDILAPIRFAVRRLRKKFANVPIAICLWGATDLAAKGDDARADATLESLQEAIEFCRLPEGSPKLTDSTRGLPGVRLVSG